MNALLYLKIRTLINAIKQLKEKPTKLIGILFYLSFLAMFFIRPNTELSEPAGIGLIGLANSPQYIISLGFFVILIIINTVTWHAGTKTGINIFTFSDTQMIFTAPYKPATILLFGMINQLKASLLSSLILLYQIPNLRNLGVTSKNIIILFILWFLAMFSNHIISAFIYALSFGSNKRKNMVLVFIYLLPIIFIGFYLFLVFRDQSFSDALLSLLESKVLYLLPGAGWTKAVFDLFLFGFTWLRLFSGLLFIFAPVVLLRKVYAMDIDFYEDALTMMQEMPTNQQNSEAMEVAKRKAYSKKSIGKTGIDFGFGENSIFFKQWREYLRSRPYLVGFPMLMVMLVLGALAFSTKGIAHAPGPLIFWGISAGILFFLSFNSTTIKALNEHQFFILPGNSFKKIFYAGLLGILVKLLDILPAYILVIVVRGFNPILLVIGLLINFSLLMVINTAQILTFRINGDLKTFLGPMLLLTLSILMCLPSIALIIIASISVSTQSVLWAYLLVSLSLIFNFSLGAFGIWVGKLYLEKGPLV